MKPKQSAFKRVGRWMLIVLGTIAVGSMPLVWICREQISEAYRHNREQRFANNVDQFGPHLIEIDRVELLRLDDGPALEKVASYTVPLYEPHQMNVAQTCVIEGQSAKEFAELWRRQTILARNGVACHEPHHVVRFFHGPRRVVDVVICFHCGNAALPVVPGHDLAMFLSDAVFQEFRAKCEALVGSAVEH